MIDPFVLVSLCFHLFEFDLTLSISTQNLLLTSHLHDLLSCLNVVANDGLNTLSKYNKFIALLLNAFPGLIILHFLQILQNLLNCHSSKIKLCKLFLTDTIQSLL